MLGFDSSLLDLLRKFLYSHIYLALQTAMAIYCFISGNLPAAIIFFIVCVALSLFLIDDFTVLFLPIALLSMAVMNNAGIKVDDFIENKLLFATLICVIVLLILAFVSHFAIYRKRHPIKKFKSGKLLIANAAVAVALLLGGCVALGIKNYERLVTVYYVLGLGVCMVAVYILLRNFTSPYFNQTAGDVLSRQMVYVCLMGIFMILFAILPYIVRDGENAHWYFPWKNGFSSMLLIAMPYTFYYSLKPKHGIIYWIIANFAFFAMFLSFSRGGMLFGTLEYIVCLIASVFFSKGHNKWIYGVLTFGIVSLLLYSVAVDRRIIDFIFSKLDFDPNEARVKLYIDAIENFMKNPLFGAGLGYMGKYFNPQETSLYWYHSTFFQVMGSMGLVGLFAYGYQFIARCKVLFAKRSLINIFTAFAFFGYYLYQMVDVCEFVPLPWMLFIAQLFVVCEHGNEDKSVIDYKIDLMPKRKYDMYKENKFI